MLCGRGHADWGESILSSGSEEGSRKTHVQKASSRSRVRKEEEIRAARGFSKQGVTAVMCISCSFTCMTENRVNVANMGTGRTGAVMEVYVSQDGGWGQGVDSCGGNEGWISQMF